MGKITVQKQFTNFFDPINLKSIFIEHIIYSSATGIDKINQYSFRKQLDEQLVVISRKAINGTYKFSKYKLKLITKGPKKEPREISIPTIRDRIALKAICCFLQQRFESSLNLQLPQNIVKDIKKHCHSNQYNAYIKLDVANFYPSINHDTLNIQLKKRIRSQKILNIIFSAIKSPTVTLSKKTDTQSLIGVPQGLSISNILAAIYMQNIDKFLAKIPNAKCYRYVDDILILCNFNESDKISKQVIKKFQQFALKIHDPIEMPQKSKIDNISSNFDYLGYTFKENLISVRNTSIENLKQSLAGIFTSYKYSRNKNLLFLEWRLNLRITGCIFENKSKGWLFFFSEINDENLLHCLDHYVKKLCNRFGVHIKQKKFVRAYKEISHRKYNSTYVPNFDNYNLEQMGKTLVEYFNFNMSNLTEEEIKFHFYKRIGGQIRDLEEDIKNFKY